MFQLNIQPKIVGRDAEVDILRSCLMKTSQGQGNVLFISGEMGIGKTRLVTEVMKIAQNLNFQVLLANCINGSKIPYMPIIEALESRGLESLFNEETPGVEAIYLFTHGGLLIKEVVREETQLNPDIFASMITSVGNFVKESLSKISGEEKEGAMNALGYEDYRILIESRQNTNLVIILTGRENESLINDMRDALTKVQEKYGEVLVDWDGDEKHVKGIEKILQTLIASGKYDGIYYGKDDPKTRRDLLFENVSMGLIRQSQKTPILLCIEDLHWADPSSLALIHYVARSARKSRLLILGTFHPEELAITEEKDHPLVATIQLMNREDLYKKIELKRLPKECMDELMGSLLGTTDFTDEFKNRIFKEAEGNPLFVIKLMKFLFEEKIIQNESGVWKLIKRMEDIDIPPRIYNVIEQRLNRVEEDYRKILDYASVIGEKFSSNILVYALKMERVQVLEKLRKLEHKYRLIQFQDGNYIFTNNKIKSVLYEEIPESMRVDYHSIIAHSFEELNKDNLEEVVGDLAFHYCNCGNKKQALLYLMKAAEKAKKENSNKKAIRFYTQALEFEEDEDNKLKILEELEDISKMIHDNEKVTT